ncbi:hypothetical protein ACE1SV_55180 [Streptomyces sp. E-15]
MAPGVTTVSGKSSGTPLSDPLRRRPASKAPDSGMDGTAAPDISSGGRRWGRVEEAAPPRRGTPSPHGSFPICRAVTARPFPPTHPAKECMMIFITVKFPVRPERSADWIDLVDDFTQATRSEPGNLFFEWSRSVDDPNEFVLVEAFRDADAGREHVESAHFRQAMETMSYAVAATPKIVSVEIPDREGWAPMAEVSPRQA